MTIIFTSNEESVYSWYAMYIVKAEHQQQRLGTT